MLDKLLVKDRWDAMDLPDGITLEREREREREIERERFFNNICTWLHSEMILALWTDQNWQIQKYPKSLYQSVQAKDSRNIFIRAMNSPVSEYFMSGLSSVKKKYNLYHLFVLFALSDIFDRWQINVENKNCLKFDSILEMKKA